MHTPQSDLAGDSKLTLKGQIQTLKDAWPLTALCFAFFFAALTTINHGVSFHPDERHMVMVTLDLEKNGMNPLSFAYGSLPFYLTWGLAKLLALLWPAAFSYDNLFLIGRGLSAFVGMLGLIATWKLAWSICNSRSVAVIATALLATNTFYFQLSRFFAVDIFLTTASLWTLWAILQIRSGKLWAFVLSGWLWGLALATKVSALNLALPLGLAILIFGCQLRMLKSAHWWIYASSIPLVGLCSFLLSEPFALIDKDLFIKHTMEQISMVRGDWRPPYIIQYAHTTPWLYPLHQIYFYTLGPFIALASGIGLLYSLRSHFSASMLIVSAWSLVTFYIYGGFPVKFPRYLLPLYPMFAIWAAIFTTGFLKNSITQNIGKLVPCFVVSISLVRWFGFYQIYSEPHAYETASRWIYQNIAPGSKLLGVDWDDRLPLSLPGLDARQYLFEGADHELQLYHPDNSDKVTQYATKLASSDYLILPTARSYGAIPRIPEEYPLSTQMFQLLFRGALGYELVYSQKTRPTFAGYVWNNDKADESLTVYDHPKVLVFKNSERLGTEQISRRLSEPYAFAPLPTRSDMLKRDGPAHAHTAQSRQSTPLAISLWVLVLVALGILGNTFTRILFTQKQDSDTGCDKVLGLALLSGTVWIGTSFNLWRSTGANAWLLFTLLTLLGLTLGYFAHRKSHFITVPKLKSYLRLDILFWLSFAGFIFLRSFQPEIFWGEKPMDFGFLNYFIRLETLPPQDPWAAGSSMRYYYFGSYMMALLHKMSGVDSAIGYNLSMATIAALSISALYSLLAYLTKKPLIALSFTILVLVGSNIEVLLLALQAEKKSFDLFWASSRLFTEPSITEYPFWAFLFADLHAHVIVVPVILTSLLFLARFFRAEPADLSPTLILHRILCGILLGLIFITNTWDAISYGLLTGIILVYTSCMHARGRYPKRAIARITSAFADLLRDGSLLAIGALPFLVIFKLNSANDLTPHFGYNHPFELNNLNQILRHLGHWLVIPCGVFLQLLLSSRSDVSRWKRLRNFLYVLILMSPPLLLSAGSPHQPQTLSWDVIAVSCFLCALGAALALNSKSSRGQRFGALSLWLAGCIMAFAELCFLMDHMNTVFKFYNAIWLLLGIANATLFSRLLQNRGARYKLLGRYFSCFVVFASGICFLVVMAGSIYNAYIMTSFRRINGPRPTLNGTAYLKENAFHEYQAIQWLRRNVQGTPVILEAYGQSYQNFTRFSMHTGLPTVLGWEYHVQQRGTSRQAVHERIQAINAIYSSDNLEIAHTYLKLLAVRYIIIGTEEQKLYANGTYNSVGLRKFTENPGLFKLRMQSGGVRIYEFGT